MRLKLKIWNLWYGGFTLCVCLYLTYTISQKFVILVKLKETVYAYEQALREEKMELDATELRLYHLKTRIDIWRAFGKDSGDMKKINKELNKLDKELNEKIKKISYGKEKLKKRKETVQESKEALKIESKLTIVQSIVAIFMAIFSGTLLIVAMQESFNCFRATIRRKLSFIDFFRYSFTNVTSFGSIEIHPITRGAKLLVLVEHLLGMFYLFGLLAGLIGLFT